MGNAFSALRRRLLLAGGSAALLGSAAAARAQFLVEVSGVGAAQIPFMVIPFRGESASGDVLGTVLSDDLVRCGAFRRIDAVSEDDPARPNLEAAKALGADVVVTGEISRASGRVSLTVRVFDAVRGTVLDTITRSEPARTQRMAPHHAADRICEILMGEPWVFASQIAYVEQRGPKSFSLVVADSDGANPRRIVSRTEPIISPAWSPDGTRLAYVSFEERKPVVYVCDAAGGRPRAVARFRGNNSAPAWSPSGTHLAVALSMSGSTQIYQVSASGGPARRLTSSVGIDTEPAYSADGKYIYFTSDRGGAPQIYRQPVAGGAPERVTWSAPYSISACPSNDGKLLAYIARANGAFRVVVQDLSNGSERSLTDTTLDESPSFAANGKVLVYATVVGGKGVLSTVTADGRMRTRLSQQGGDIREPAWGPRIP